VTAIADALNAALQHYQAGRLHEAELLYRQVLQAQPEHPDALHALGVIAYDVGQYEPAVTYIKKALETNPNVAEFHNHIGAAYRAQGRLEEATAHYQRALALMPQYAEAYNNLGNVLQERGLWKDAMDCFRRAVTLKPDYAQAHFSHAMTRLLFGNFSEGWSEYEWRWGITVLKLEGQALPQPLWDGSKISGRTILLHAEQGLGDTIQFIRYVPLVAKLGAQVIVQCQPELKSLLDRVEGMTCLKAKGEPLPAFDLQAPLLSLPLAFATTADTIPAHVPYLSAEPKLVAAWKRRLGAKRRALRVGLAWAGRQTHTNDRNRSCPLAIFAPLAGVRDVTFYSLQKGEAAREAAAPPEGMTLIDLAGALSDFAETAALISQLDLVISVDTAVAHLAGAMGRPVWTLLPFAPDWRWLLVREDSPWYPTMRLFRQNRLGDWPEVFTQVAEALKSF
jgi:hypothetical protein